MNGKLLWVDDEIELLKAHILFIEKKGYEITTVTNGSDAIDLCREETFDLILLDENMPGLSGLETLSQIKAIAPNTPIVMVTKSEEENIMEQAIGSKIADYLIKPVNPSQILLALKKNIHQRELQNEVAQSNYQQNFGQIGMQINDSLTSSEWKELYKKLVYWELELENTDNTSMVEMLNMQKKEANSAFAKFIEKNYVNWLQSPAERPIMSNDIFKTQVFPHLSKGEKVFLIVLDNFRFDQWRSLSGELSTMFNIDEDLYFSILPTATQYARNAIFSGLMPSQIEKMFPDLWIDEDSEEGKNMNESPLIKTQLDRFRRKENFSYTKINDSQGAEKYASQMSNLMNTPLNVCVLNFIDMLSHARTESKMVRELASNEAAYRAITLSWFKHSAVNAIFKTLSESDYHVIVTTDHGSIRVNNPVKVIGDKNTNTNLRYKLGKNLNYDKRNVMDIKNPQEAMLPSPNISTSYIFASGADFFAYPNNYNYYVSYYRDTFQHGGISLEEMLIPLITLTPKKK